mgnify:CR=1 FL=1
METEATEPFFAIGHDKLKITGNDDIAFGHFGTIGYVLAPRINAAACLPVVSNGTIWSSSPWMKRMGSFV